MKSTKRGHRICIVLPAHWEAQQGGAEYQAHVLAEELAGRGHEVHWLSRKTPAHDPARSHVVHRITPHEGWRKRGFFLDVFALTRLLRQLKPDVIYQRVGCAYTGITARYARESGCDMIWHVARDDEVTPTPNFRQAVRNPFRLIEKKFLEYGVRRARQIVIQTEGQRELLARHYGRRDAVLIPNFHPVPEHPSIKHLPFKVVWVANFKKIKRPDQFIELAARFSDEPGFEFIMVGSPVPDSPWQKDLEARMRVLPNLRYPGRLPQDEVNRLLAEAHVLINTSEYEGLPNTFIQAWMREAVVLSLAVNPGGYLDRPSLGECTGTLDRMEARLRELVGNPAQLAEHGQVAMNFAYEEFSSKNLDRLVGRLLDSTRASVQGTDSLPTGDRRKIAFFLQGKLTPSSRFRVLQYLDRFTKAGFESLCFYPITSKYGRVPDWVPTRPLRLMVRRLLQLLIYLPHRWWQIRRSGLRHFDAVIIQKPLSAWPKGTYLERMIARRNPRIIFDLDDAEFTNPLNPQRPKVNDLILRVAGMARAVVVCNQYLYDLIAPVAQAVVRFPTALDEQRYLPTSPTQKNRLTLGWTGSGSTLNCLRMVLPALEVVLQRYEADLLIISDRSHVDWLAHLPGIRFLQWNPVDEVSQLQEMDIGIMPLPDDPWTRGKCAFKIVQYMAVGIPAIASPVGMNCEVIEEGVTGFFAETTQEWIDQIELLIGSPSRRAEMGAAARIRFEERLSGTKVANEWIRLLHDVMATRK